MLLPDPNLGVLDALPWTDEEALVRRCQAMDDAGLAALLKRAYAGDDLRTIVTAGPVFAGRDAFRTKDANHIAPALAFVGRYEQALGVLSHPAVRGHHLGVAHHLLAARALGALGRIDEAIAAADRALALEPGARKALPVRDALAEAAGLAARDLSDDPAEACRLAKLFLAQGLRPAAKQALEQVVTGRARAAVSQPSAALDAAELALQLLAPDRIHAFLTLNAALLTDGARREALLAVCEVLLGRPGRPLPPDGASRDLQMARAFALEAAGDLEGAIARLGPLSDQYLHDGDVRRMLCRCVGAKVLQMVQPRFPARTGRRRIFNLLPFYNEFTMLRMRLAEMADWVDHFVIVEAAQTFTGRPKPLNFLERQAEFAPFAGKITYIPVDAFPPYVDTAWSRDFFQRDQAVRGLVGRCAGDDLVLLTDADEIVDRKAVEGFEGECAGLEMAMFRYFLNYRLQQGQPKRAQVKSSIWRAAYLERFGSSYLRFYPARDKQRRRIIPDAGWHFTSMMDAAEVARKMTSYAHQEHRLKQTLDEDHYRGLLGRIRAGTPEPGWERCEIDETYPAFVRTRPDELAHLLL